MPNSSARSRYIALGRELLTALVWGCALAVGSLDTHTTPGIWGACIGGFLGSLKGYSLKDSRWRSWSMALCALVGYGLWSWLCSWLIDSTLLASMLGINKAYLSYDFCNNLGCSLIAVTALHALAWRHPAITALELITISVALASPLAGHRDGYICRPYGFVDALWSRGYDPVPFFKYFGVMVACLFIVATVGRYNRRSTILDLSALLVLALILSTFAIPNVLTLPLPEQVASGETGEGQEPPPPPSGKPQNQNDKQNQNDQDKQQNKNNQQDQQDQDNQPDQDDQQNQDDQQDRDDQQDQDNQQSPPPPSDNQDQQNNQSSKPQPQNVAVVVFYQDYNPAGGLLYFRQGAQSQFNGTRIIEEPQPKFDTDIFRQFPAGENNKAPNNPVPIATEDMAILKPITTKVCLMIPHDAPFGLMTPQTITGINNPNTNQFVRAYQVQSLAFTGDLETVIDRPTGDASWDDDTLFHYLKMPDDPRYEELAQQITADLSDSYRDNPVAKVIVCKLWLEENCVYDVNSRVRDDQDVVAKFLFGERRGYCVHLAHSLTYLARVLGVPARVGTGYAVDARNRYGGSSLLITSDRAHAWCEIYLDGLGWFPIDVSPKQVASGSAGPPPDAELQKMLGELARGQSGLEDNETSAPRDLHLSMQKLLAVVGQSLGVLAVLAIVAAYFAKIYRRIIPVFCAMPRCIDTTYRAALDRLSDVGLRRHYGEAREDFATRCQDSLPALAELTALHMRKALGDPSVPPHADRAKLRKVAAALCAQIRAAFPWWKRCLGALNPFSWLLTK